MGRLELKWPNLRYQENGDEEHENVERQADAHEVGELVVVDTLHNQVGLVAYRGCEPGRRCYAYHHEERRGIDPKLRGYRQREREGQCCRGIVGYQLGDDVGDDVYETSLPSYPNLRFYFSKELRVITILLVSDESNSQPEAVAQAKQIEKTYNEAAVTRTKALCAKYGLEAPSNLD